MSSNVPEYVVCWDYTANLDHYWCTYSDRPGQDMRRVVSKSLPLRQTELEALLDLQAWLEKRYDRGDNYLQIGKQITRVAGEIVGLQREAWQQRIRATAADRMSRLVAELPLFGEEAKGCG